jgi:hypothetical protein
MLIRTLTRMLGGSLLVVGAAAHSGTVLEMVNRDLTNKTESVVKTFAQDGRMRVDSGGPQDTVMIFRDETLYTLDPKQKTYLAMDRAMMQKLASQLNPALKMLQEQMKNMSPEQRAQIERMTGTKLPGSSKEPLQEIRKTSRTGKVAGYTCTYAEVLQDGVLQHEACVVPAAELKGSKELYDVSVKVGALVKDMMSSIDAPWMQQMVDRQMENFSGLGGLPVLTRTFDEGKPLHEATMKAIRTEAVPATQFELPADYKPRELPSIGAAPAQP